MHCIDPDDNPFATQSDYTTVTIRCREGSVPAIEQLFEEDALSITAFEKDKGAYWQVEVLLLNDEAFRAHKDALLALDGVEAAESNALEMRDWVKENQASFPPLEIGSFYIHGSHLPPKPEAISLEIDAGRAFGTGEHATTALCLLALEQCDAPAKLADIGCGTGILALAAKRLWPQAQIIGSDRDAPSVETAIENAEKNRIDGVEFIAATGWNHPTLAQHAPYPLIVANILAGPLIELAPEMARHLAPGGTLILSGLLIRQEAEVLAAYEAQGFHKVKHYHRDDWSALKLSERR